MARPKAFDCAQALLAAMQVFWVKGYEATSLEDLLAAMKIGRQSLYDTFGDKRALFMEALVQYRELTDAYLRGCLADAPTVKAAFQRLFMQVVDEPEAHQRRGCLLINSAVELAPHDPQTARSWSPTSAPPSDCSGAASSWPRSAASWPPIGTCARWPAIWSARCRVCA